MTTGQAAKRTGVTVRTLRYYDEIGLLRPSVVSENGYRQYEEGDLRMLEEIVALRKAGAPIGEIRGLLSQEDYSRAAWLKGQLTALQAKKQKVEESIVEVEKQLEEMGIGQSLAGSGPYAQAAKERWEDTEAYADFASRQAKRSETEREGHAQQFQERTKEILQKLARLEREDPGSSEVQNLVGQWQDAITEHWYVCTKDILLGLSKMYEEDPRFSAYFAGYGSGSLASFFARAIEIWCNKA